MSVVVAMKEIGPCRQEVTIEVPGPAVQQETERVTRDLRKQVQLPGFRKGKVPASLVRQRFAGDIRQEVLDRLVPQYWETARQEKELDPLLPPELGEVGELADGEPLTFTAVVETRPPIELGDLSGFDLPEPDVEPTEAEVDEQLDNVRRQVADWKPVERPAARGDRVQAQITEILDDDEGEPKSDTLTVEVGDERVWEELTLALTGLAPGGSARFSHRGEDPSGESRERHFEVQALAVEERDLPELDDGFAEKVGFDTVEELREAIEKDIRRNKERGRREQRETALLDQLRARHPLTLPQGVVSHEVEHLLNEYAGSLARNGVDVQNANIDWRKLGEDVRPQAESRVHARLLLDAVAQRDGIEVGDEEVEQTLSTIARSQGTNVPTLRRSLEREGGLEGLERQLRRNKTIRHLLGEDAEPAGQETEPVTEAAAET